MDNRNYTNPFVTIFHPFDGAYDIRFKNRGSWLISCVILVLLFFASVFSRQNTSYIFNYNKLSDFNVLLQLLGVALPFGLFVISNWIMGILLDGTARFRDIFIYTCYCLVPFTIATFAGAVVSNGLTMEEPFANYLIIAGATWSIVIEFIGLMVMHEYGFVKNCFSCACTLATMLILVFLIMLGGSLASDFVGFVTTITREILFRMS